MNYFAIPVTPEAQVFRVALGGTEYEMRLTYRAGAGWVLDLSIPGGARIASGIPLVTGVDLLAQHRHHGLKGSLWVQGADNPDDVPTFENLGRGARLFWATD